MDEQQEQDPIAPLPAALDVAAVTPWNERTFVVTMNIMSRKSAVVHPEPSPYGSAMDLPSVQKQLKLLQGGKLVTRVIARDQRQKLVDLEAELRRLMGTVDQFYNLLGARHWVFTDCFSVDDIEKILDSTDDAEAAEAQLIELHRNPETTKFWLMRLQGTDGLRQRMHQIKRAMDHYQADQFDSCVLQLIAVMDGFVNDFEPEKRQGLAARDPEEMVAWDSVVGHSLGLSNALKPFTKTIKKRIDKEVHDVFRHGIVHGSVINFDNVIVASKAWNLLFALDDWAKATIKAQRPADPEPQLREVFAQLAKTQRLKQGTEAWEPQSFSQSDAGFNEHEIAERTRDFMNAWESGNYGMLATFQRRMLVAGDSPGAQAGQMRDLFDFFHLSEYELSEIDNEAPVIYNVHGTATVNGQPGTFKCRWILEEDDGTPAPLSETAQWGLVFCNPTIWTLQAGLSLTGPGRDS